MSDPYDVFYDQAGSLSNVDPWLLRAQAQVDSATHPANPTSPKDQERSIRSGAIYMNDLLTKHGDVGKALSVYSNGDPEYPGKVAKAYAALKANAPSKKDEEAFINGTYPGAPLPPNNPPGAPTTAAEAGPSKADEEAFINGTYPGAPLPPNNPPGAPKPAGLGGQYMDAAPDTPLTRSLGKPVAENQQPGMLTQAAGGLPTDPEQKRRIIAAQLFPGMPLQEALGRVTYDNGRMVAIGKDDKPFYVDPVPVMAGRTVMDTIGNAVSDPGNLARNAATGVGAALPVAGGIAGGLVASPTSLVAGPALVATGAAAGDAARQFLANRLDPQPGGVPYDFEQTGREAALSGLGQLGGAVIGRAMAPNRLMVPQSEIRLARTGNALPNAADAYANATAQGVDLTPGQASGIRSLLQYEDAVKQNPGLVDRAMDFYSRQGAQLKVAAQNMLARISPVADKTEAAMMLQDGASNAIRSVRQDANSLARDAYQRAEQTPMPAAVPGQTKPIMGATDMPAVQGANYVPGSNVPLPADRFKPYDLLGTPDGLHAYNAARISAANDGIRMPTIDEIEKGAPVSFQGWDYMKQNLQGHAMEEAQKGNRYRAGQLSDMSDGIKNEVIKVNPAYGEALDTVAPGQRLARQLADSAAGKVGEGTGSEPASAILTSMFQGQNPVAIAKARDAFYSTGKADEWHAGVRGYIQDAIDKASTSQEGLNAASLKRNVWNKADVQANLKAAMTPEQFDGFQRFLKTVGDVAQTYPMNSLTDMRRNAGAALVDAASNTTANKLVRTVGALGSPSAYFRGLPTITDPIGQWITGRNVKSVVDSLFTGDGMRMLTDMARVPPGSHKAVSSAMQILTRATPELSAASGVSGQPGSLPPNRLSPPE